MTTIIQFNKTLSEFLTKLINIFPVTKTEIMQHYGNLLNGENSHSDSYCNDFINHTSNYAVEIANKNDEVFIRVPYFMPGINFSQIWGSDFNTDTTKKSIWIYLNVFYKLANQYKSEKETTSNMTPEQLISYNLQEANKEKLSAREQLIQNLSDRELRKELERRKAIKYNTEQAEIDEEDLLNFDPNEGFSYFGVFKRFLGNGKVGRDINGFIKKGYEMFNINPDDFNINDIDFNNLSGTFTNLFTAENIEKIKTKVLELITKVQDDINNGKINVDQFKDMVNNLKSKVEGAEGAEGESTGEGFNINNLFSQDMMNAAMSMAESYSGQKVSPEQRNQLNSMMQDPTQILNMFSRGQINQALNANRGNAVRDRLRKKHDEKQKSKQN